MMRAPTRRAPVGLPDPESVPAMASVAAASRMQRPLRESDALALDTRLDVPAADFRAWSEIAYDRPMTSLRIRDRRVVSMGSGDLAHRKSGSFVGVRLLWAVFALAIAGSPAQAQEDSVDALIAPASATTPLGGRQYMRLIWENDILAGQGTDEEYTEGHPRQRRAGLPSAAYDCRGFHHK